jgi:excisionase family DNA binding protein
MNESAARTPKAPPLLNLPEARAYLGGISNQTLYRLIADRSLRLVKVRRRSFIYRADIDALIERSTSDGGDG